MKFGFIDTSVFIEVDLREVYFQEPLSLFCEWFLVSQQAVIHPAERGSFADNLSFLLALALKRASWHACRQRRTRCTTWTHTHNHYQAMPGTQTQQKTELWDSSKDATMEIRSMWPTRGFGQYGAAEKPEAKKSGQSDEC